MVRVVAFFLCLPLFLAPPAGAVVVLDSTWAGNGGAEGAEAEGFAAHIALAEAPEFAAIIGLWDGTQYGGSGTWIGNDAEGFGYVLTAAHNFDGDADPARWTYYTRDGAEFQGLELFIHPDYADAGEDFGGADLAVVRLDGPVTDAGQAPLLYGGRDEVGRVATITGFGSRGIGSAGEADEYYADEVAAAARNVIDAIEGKGGLDQLLVDFDSEAGDANALDGDALPVDEYEGILGSGDSGGSTWIETAQGWVIAGVNSWGDDAVYGSISAMTRVSTQIEWITSVAPPARFTD
jgi:hypothetical protein